MAVAPPLMEPAGPGLVSPSISVVIPVDPADAPPDSRGVGISPLLMCRFVVVVNGAAVVAANEALSLLVFAANSVLV